MSDIARELGLSVSRVSRIVAKVTENGKQSLEEAASR